MSKAISRVLAKRRAFEDYHKESNAGIGITLTLILLALHDEFSWQKVKISHLKDEVDSITLPIEALTDEQKRTTYWQYHDDLIKHGMSERLFRDYVTATPRAVGAKGKREAGKVMEAAELAYIYFLAGVRRRWKYGKTKLLTIQERMKQDVYEIKLGHVPLVEFMKVVSLECGEHFSGLDRYEQIYGVIDPYGPYETKDVK